MDFREADELAAHRNAARAWADANMAPNCADEQRRAAVVTTVYGGTSEILRDIIAQRHLGLPRNRPSR